MQGTRKQDNFEPINLLPGEYTKHENGDWWLYLPGMGKYKDSLARINSNVWSIIEHEDNTITVNPSIRQSTKDRELWHGFLKSGIWSVC
jgi:hypothetical protein